EHPIRLALLWISMHLCSIVTGFLAFGVRTAGKAGWRWLFLIGGGITLLIGVATFFRICPLLPPRPKGWLYERGETIMVNRILRNDSTKEGLLLKRLRTAICDYNPWPLYIL
ncbi:hypothetical protein F5J12DRAFT_722157, partial [Pisolithus orientalis]|uniref:uncharacterized protein n=1 Tax=Pisolithus orientalis TaxID=936130 RepID=UPI002224600C